jgi:hypothetical protein
VGAFWVFHRANPQVYRQLKDIALSTHAAGWKTFGIAALFERLRWISKMETVGDPYTLNNNFRAYYARLLMRNEPELRDFFVVRRQPSQIREAS